jgi:hypothetical protein
MVLTVKWPFRLVEKWFSVGSGPASGAAVDALVLRSEGSSMRGRVERQSGRLRSPINLPKLVAMEQSAVWREESAVWKWQSAMLPMLTRVLAEHSGLLFWHSGVLAERSGLLFWHSGVLAERSGLLFWHSGVLAERSGLLFWCSGVLAERSGLLFCHSGLLRRSPGGRFCRFLVGKWLFNPEKPEFAPPTRRIGSFVAVQGISDDYRSSRAAGMQRAKMM